ncbi:MGMT family protein [Limnohabitans sp. MMS-10A-178]|uniref:MGMT family protein n=1 Tax=Limnohabitans sp. MMS-10A-178 TaxID=1835767 RepID=UPI000D362117|nr:hypothetical protein B9Z32_13135 [Limnohabitans sp. MMS-10A-178]
MSAGTEFQHAVWQLLMSIPMCQTCRHGQLASAIGCNPFRIFTSGHLVLGGQAKITGYAGGIWCEQALLQLESALSQR